MLQSKPGIFDGISFRNKAGKPNAINQESPVEPTGQKAPPASTEPGAWAYTTEGLQLALTLLLGFFAGYKADQWWETSPWLTLAGSLIGVVAGMYIFLRRFLRK